MTILWHSVKYPPKKDGTYYFRTICTVPLHDLRERTKPFYEISTLGFTTDKGWNTHRDFDGVSSDSGFRLDENAYWAEIEYVDD